MADIMITLSTDSRVYAGSIEQEANWAKSDGPLWYPLPTMPRRASEGCWVYFILRGYMVGRARINKIRSKRLWTGRTHKGKLLKHHGPAVVCSSVQVATSPVKHSGFQGYRYVAGPLLMKFHKAFNAP